MKFNNQDSGDNLYKVLPKYFKLQDSEDLFLKRYLESCGVGIDTLNGRLNTILNNTQVANCEESEIYRIAKSLGANWIKEVPSKYHRKLTNLLTTFYKRKGNKDNLVYIAKEMSGLDASIEELNQDEVYKLYTDHLILRNLLTNNLYTNNKNLYKELILNKRTYIKVILTGEDDKLMNEEGNLVLFVMKKFTPVHCGLLGLFLVYYDDYEVSLTSNKTYHSEWINENNGEFKVYSTDSYYEYYNKIRDMWDYIKTMERYTKKRGLGYALLNKSLYLNDSVTGAYYDNYTYTDTFFDDYNCNVYQKDYYTLDYLKSDYEDKKKLWVYYYHNILINLNIEEEIYELKRLKHNYFGLNSSDVITNSLTLNKGEIESSLDWYCYIDRVLYPLGNVYSKLNNNLYLNSYKYPKRTKYQGTNNNNLGDNLYLNLLEEKAKVDSRLKKDDSKSVVSNSKENHEDMIIYKGE